MVNQSRPHLLRDLNANSAISLQNDFAFNSGTRGERLRTAPRFNCDCKPASSRAPTRRSVFLRQLAGPRLDRIADVYHEAVRSYEKALKSGIQLQEESVNLWKDLLTKLGSPEEFRAKLESMTADAFPKARKRMEEFVETFNRTSNQTIDLFEKTLGVYQATSVPDC